MLADFIKAIDYKITGGSDFGWNCYGLNARYLDCEQAGANGFSISAIFDTVTQEVYAVEAWDHPHNREYRWLNPVYRKDYELECVEREIGANESIDSRKFVDVELADDIFEKINAIVRGVDYDTRVMVPLNLNEEELFSLMKMAHQQDLTLNQLVENVLTEEIFRIKSAE